MAVAVVLTAVRLPSAVLVVLWGIVLVWLGWTLRVAVEASTDGLTVKGPLHTRRIPSSAIEGLTIDYAWFAWYRTIDLFVVGRDGSRRPIRWLSWNPWFVSYPAGQRPQPTVSQRKALDQIARALHGPEGDRARISQ